MLSADQKKYLENLTSKSRSSASADVSNEQYLRDLYYNPKSTVAYSNISQLWRKIKEDGKPIKYKELKEFLSDLKTYQLHKPITGKFLMRKTMVSSVDQQWQADLVDMQKYAKINNNYKYILTVIDVFSRYAWALPLKSKRGEEVKDLFVGIFKEARPGKLQFDDGKEFYNKFFKELLEKNDIEWFSTFSDKKASVVERFNRTLKTRMWKYFTAEKTEKWTSILDDLTAGYNNTFHSSIGMKPVEARKEVNSGTVWYNLYGAFLTNDFGQPKFKIDEYVRIKKYKTTFAKGYLPNFTEEIFKIKQIIFSKPIVYQLEDRHDEPIEGYFYAQELSHTQAPLFKRKIENVLWTKKIKGKEYALVKFTDSVSNEWVPLDYVRKNT